MLSSIVRKEMVEVLVTHQKQETVDGQFDCSCGFESDDQEIQISFEEHLVERLETEVTLFGDLREEFEEGDRLVNGVLRSVLLGKFTSFNRVVAPDFAVQAEKASREAR